MNNPMRLAVTLLGKQTGGFIVDILSAINTCQCSVQEMRSANLTQLLSIYLLIEGNWNHIAKLESMLESLKNRYELQISIIRPEMSPPVLQGLPYLLELISSDNKDVLFAVSDFLHARGIQIEEVTASRHPAPFFNGMMFSSKFLLLVPENISVLVLREEFMDFCDSLNVDSILEPIKR